MAKDVPHMVAVRSVGLSRQMTHLRFERRIGLSLAPSWALICSCRCFCSVSPNAFDDESSARSTASMSIIRLLLLLLLLLGCCAGF